MLPAAAASGWIGALVALPFASHLDVGAHQLVNLALFGITSFGLGLLPYTIGARYLHPARTALISTLDTPLAPLWVWVAFNERPALTNGRRRRRRPRRRRRRHRRHAAAQS